MNRTVFKREASDLAGANLPLGSATSSKPIIDLGLVIFLILVELAYVMLATANPDTARDIIEARQICSGENFPLTGPDFSGRFRLGPFWFYVISPFACARNPLLTVGLAVGFISALKYPLAYILGRRLVSRDFAILWLPLLAILSWPATLTIFIHTSGLITLLLLALLILTTIGKTRVVLSAFLFGLVTSLAINLHPSAYPFVLLAFIPVWNAVHQRCLSFTVLAGLAGGLIPFLPVLVAMLSDTGLAESNSGVLNVLTASNLTRIPHYLWQMATGPIASSSVTAARVGFSANALWALYGSVFLLSCYGLLRLSLTRRENTRHFYGFLALLGLTIAFSLAITPMRVHYPHHMLLVTVIPFSAMLTMGLLQLNLRLQSIALLFCILLISAPLAGHYRAANNNELKSPIREIADLEIVFQLFEYLPHYFWSTVQGFSADATLVCETGTSNLHGYLPLQINDGLSLLTKSCKPVTPTDQPEWLSLPDPVWKALGKEPVRSISKQGLFKVLAQSPDADLPRFATSYPPYQGGQQQATRTLNISAQSNAFLFLSNLNYFFPLKITGLQTSNGEASIVFQDEYATILECDSCQAGQVDWNITVTAGNLSPLDLVAF